jgi:hypothetical protein
VKGFFGLFRFKEILMPQRKTEEFMAFAYTLAHDKNGCQGRYILDPGSLTKPLRAHDRERLWAERKARYVSHHDRSYGSHE